MSNPFFGNIQAPADGNFDMSNSGFVNIPDGTKAKAVIEVAQWEAFTDQEKGTEQTFIKATWSIIEGEFTARKVFQKMHVQDQDASKSQRALQMLAAIDANAGGKIMAAGTMPDDMMLGVSITNVPMVITIAEWDINGKTGNYVSAVSRAQAPVQAMSQGQAINQAVNNVQSQAQPAQHAQPAQPQQQPAQQVQYAQPTQPAQPQHAQSFDDIDF